MDRTAEGWASRARLISERLKPCSRPASRRSSCASMSTQTEQKSALIYNECGEPCDRRLVNPGDDRP